MMTITTASSTRVKPLRAFGLKRGQDILWAPNSSQRRRFSGLGARQVVLPVPPPRHEGGVAAPASNPPETREL